MPVKTTTFDVPDTGAHWKTHVWGFMVQGQLLVMMSISVTLSFVVVVSLSAFTKTVVESRILVDNKDKQGECV